MRFEFFTEETIDKCRFYPLSKYLFTNPRFKNVSVEAKVLYAMLLDVNETRDSGNFNPLELLNCDSSRLDELLEELDEQNGVGLIRVVNDKIYVKAI